MNNKKHKVLASATVMSLLLSTVATVTPVKAAEVNRLSGETRETTAVDVAKKVFGKAEAVIIVNGYGYADAVSATPLAKQLGAPILLTNSNGTSIDVQALKDLGAKKVIIIGGTGAVSSALAAQLDKEYQVERIQGQNRYETNANVAKEVLKLTGKKEAILVSAEGYADALSVASIAAAKGVPVLFANSKEVPAAVKAVADGLTIKAVGGTGVLPEGVLATVSAERITKNAKDRFQTNLEVLEYYKNELAGVKKVYMAAGGNAGSNNQFADALVASAAAAKDGAPVVLTGLGANATQKTAANEYVVDRMDKDTVVSVVGGVASVADSDVKAVEDKKEELNKVVELKVEGVSAIKAKGIEVTFNDEIDTTKASIVVKKGNVTVNVDSIEFAEDKKSAVINTTTKLTKGEYTVTVSGLTEEALVASFEAENEKVADINVLSETAPLNPAAVAGGIGGVNYQANETAFVNYEVLNQYGEKMSNQTITWTQSTGGKVADDGKGKLTIGNTATAGTKFIPGNKVFLTGVHGNTATVVNAEVTIGLEAKVAEVEFKGVYNTTKQKLEDLPAGFAGGNYVLLFEAKDQYGNKVDTTAGELTLLSDNPLFIAQPTALGADVTIDDVDYKALQLNPGTQVAKGGTATIQVVSNNTGKVAKYTINADALSAVTEFSISAPEELVAGGEKVEVPFTAVDQYGNAVTKHSELNGKVTLSANLAFEKQQDGSAKLFYTTPANATQNDRIDTLTTLIPTNGDYSNIQLTVKPNATPEAIIGLNEDVSTSIAAGNNVEFKGEDLLVQDQYGRTLKKNQVNDWLDGAGDTAIVIESDNGAGAITVTSSVAGSTDSGFNFVEASGETFTVAATTAAGANTEKLVFSLSTGATPPTAASVVSASSKSVTFTRVAQSEYASYEVADLGTLYNNATPGTATPGYKVVPKVYGVTEAGKKVLLPASKYSITTNGKLDVSTPGEIADLATAGYDAPDFKDANGNAKDITVKVTIMVEDGNGAAAATIEKDLVVSNATPVTETVTLTDKVVNGAAFVDKEALNNDEPGAGATATKLALNNFIKEIKDQYGVVITPTADITISKVEKVDGSTLEVAKNGQDDVEITGATEGDKFTATFKYAGGKTVSVNFVVSDN